MAKLVKLENFDRAVIYGCHLRAVEIAGGYHELVDIYQAARRVFGAGLLCAQLVTAINIRMAELGIELKRPKIANR